MKAVDRYQRMLEDPVGRVFAGRSFLLWCVDRTLIGVTLWGRPSETDVARLLALLDSPLDGKLELPCDNVFDARHVEGIDAEVFERFLEGLARRRRALTARIRRQVLLRPAGLAGAIVAGVSSVLRPGVPWAVSTDLGAALRWLGRDDAAAVADELEHLARPFFAGNPLLAELRALFRATHFHLGLEESAQRLGLGPRSLQRQLRAQGTSFRAELDQERVVLAQRLLRDTELKLEVVGQRIGCARATHFTTFFRDKTGYAPSAWRARHRPPLPP